MAYATLQDIQDELPQIRIDNSSKPTQAQVEDSLVLIESHVNAVLHSRGYTTPIAAGPESLKLLRKIVRHGVAAEVIRQQQGAVRDQGATGRNEHQRIYDDLLAHLYLPDAESGDTEKPFYAAGPTYDTDLAFTRGQTF